MGPKSVSKKENVAKVGRPRKKKETTNKKECTTPPPQKESKRKRELNEESTVKFKKISKKAKTKSNDEDDVLTPLPPHKVTPTLKDTKDKRTSIQHTLSDFNGNDSYFNDESQFISCCFCHQYVRSIPLFW